MTRKQLIYVLALFEILFCCCMILAVMLGDTAEPAAVEYDREIAIAGEYVIFIKREVELGEVRFQIGVLSPRGVEWMGAAADESAISKAYFDKEWKFNFLKVYLVEEWLVVKHSAYSLAGTTSQTLFYDAQSDKSFIWKPDYSWEVSDKRAPVVFGDIF